MKYRQFFKSIIAPTLLAGLLAAPACAGEKLGKHAQRLIAAYADALKGIENGELIWRDGTRMPMSDGHEQAKTTQDKLDNPSIEDMLETPYPTGPAKPPPEGSDPGRARPAAFFDKMYGDCTKDNVRKHLVAIPWLPGKTKQRLFVTTINGVDKKLTAVSNDLSQLPAKFDRFLIPSAGTYVCRTIAGTNRRSAHGYGIAIDIATKHADYWRWPSAPAGKPRAWRNQIPMEIVEVFEKHGFIWGGRWHHYDTMHFEYRPELLPQASGSSTETQRSK